MAQPSSSFSEKFNAATPAGAERVISESGMRGTFEDLWKQGKVDTSDLWNQRRFWEGRDTLLGKGEKPGLEEAANGAAEAANNIEPSNEFIAQPDPIAAAVNAMNPQPRQTLEQGLNDMLERPMDSGSFNFDDFTRDPQNYQQEYLSKISPENRALFEQRLADFGGAGAESMIDHVAEDDHETGLVNENSMAFLAVAIGSGEAGRIHEYLRSRDNGSTLAGGGSHDKDDSADEKANRNAKYQLAQQTTANLLSEFRILELEKGDLQKEWDGLQKEIDRLNNEREELLTAEAQAEEKVAAATKTADEMDKLALEEQTQQMMANGGFDLVAGDSITMENDAPTVLNENGNDKFLIMAEHDDSGNITGYYVIDVEAEIEARQALEAKFFAAPGGTPSAEFSAEDQVAIQAAIDNADTPIPDVNEYQAAREATNRAAEIAYSPQQRMGFTGPRAGGSDFQILAMRANADLRTAQEELEDIRGKLAQNQEQRTEALERQQVVGERINEIEDKQHDLYGSYKEANPEHADISFNEFSQIALESDSDQFQTYRESVEELNDLNTQQESIHDEITAYDQEILRLENRIAELEQTREQEQEELQVAEKVEQEAIEQAGSAHERRLTNWRGETVYEDERFGGLGLSYEDAETGEIKQHNIVASVAGQAAHAWQDFWKDDAQTGNQIDEVTEKAAAASETRQQTAEQLEQTTAELQAAREQQAELAARQRALAAESAPAASLENTSRYSAVVARSELSNAPEGGKLSSAFGDAVNGTTETPQTDLPAPAPLTNEQNLQLATNSM